MAEYPDYSSHFEDPAVEQNEAVELEGVSAVITDSDGTIMLKHNKFGGLWTIPVGKPEDGETPEDAIIREMYEELGIEITGLDRVGRVLYRARFDNAQLQANIVFHITGFKGEIRNAEPQKHSEIRRFTLQELLELDPKKTTTATLRAIQYLINERGEG